MDPNINLIGLGFKLMTDDSTIEYLQEKEILPHFQTCSGCQSKMFTKKRVNNYVYFVCHSCQHKKSIRHGTCLSGANLSLRSFVIMAYLFTNLTNLTYTQSKFKLN